MNPSFYTIGHSTRTLEEFIDLLRMAKVELVADIRTVPRSRANPQYNRDTLPDSLATFGIDYEFIAQLGGLRSKSRTVLPDVNSFWKNRSFHNYADYALSDAFQEGLDKLIELGHKRCCAMMCAEAVWWRCHRRIVSDYLLARGEVVFHLMGHTRIEAAHFTEGAHVHPSCQVTYPSQHTAID
ncbi:DUF488 domain-containing protein [Nitrosomonas sp. HPC101]|uniref:DUF488 domain-containing protein n=1 Tax=Nitrosomonas sp. HPC101 TaxID=1658667 RepID=UPI0013691A6C|nr:DUF488 domain-containing protein [Nitrosomonas sp. HPC101]MXS85221.1 DUF488 domain-containing protein [Nitrosomonas sp. HPC101]